MRFPPKEPWLRAVTITIIMRAFCLRGVSSAYFAQLPPLSSLWHSVQFIPVEAAKNPIVSRNSSTGTPLRSWTFLKACSAKSGFCSAPPWAGDCPLANTTPSRHTHIIPVARRTTCLDPSVILPPRPRIVWIWYWS